MPDREKVIKGLESIRDICNAKSNMAIGKGKIAWAGYANTADDAIGLLKEKEAVVRCKDCKHKWWINQNNEKVVCRYCYGEHEPNWFCGDGEPETH